MQWITRILIGISTLLAGIMGIVLISNRETLGEALKEHYENSLEAGRDAAASKRQELEADLARMMQDKNSKKE